MKPIARLFFPILLCAILLSCMDDIMFTPKETVIEYGTECGWCAGSEYIKVTRGTIIYTRNIPCGQNEGTTQITRILPDEKWVALTESLDYEKFRRLRYETFNVHADGCDEIIRVSRDGNIHQIRYNPGEEIPAIDNLQDLLGDLMNEFRQDD